MPTAITAADLDQFWRWLVEHGSALRETKVVARDFVALRHSAEGRKLLGEPEKRPLRLETAAPLTPRFQLEGVPRRDPTSNLPADLS